MTRIAVVNTKGGVGKTTVATHLAGMLAQRAPTLLIDGDPQASAASWAAWRREANREPSPTTTCLLGKAGRERFYARWESFAGAPRRWLRVRCARLARQLREEGKVFLVQSDEEGF